MIFSNGDNIVAVDTATTTITNTTSTTDVIDHNRAQQQHHFDHYSAHSGSGLNHAAEASGSRYVGNINAPQGTVSGLADHKEHDKIKEADQTLKSSMEDLQTKYYAIYNEYSGCMKDLERVVFENEMLKEAKEAKERECEGLKLQVKRANNENASALEKSERDLEIIRALESELKELKNGVTELQESSSKWQEKTVDLQNKSKSKTEQLENLRAIIETLNGQLKTADENEQSLQAELRGLKENERAMDSEVERIKTKLKSTQIVCEKLEHSNANLKVQLDNMCDNVQQTSDRIIEEKTALLNDVDELSKENTALNNYIFSLKDTLKSAQEALESELERSEKSQVCVSERDAIINELRGKFVSLKSAITSSTDRINSLERELNIEVERRKTVEEKYNQQRKEMNARTSSESKNKLIFLEQKCKLMESELKEKSDQVSDLESQLRAFNEEYRQRLRSKEKENAALKDSMRKLEVSFRDTQEEFEQKLHELSSRQEPGGRRTYSPGMGRETSMNLSSPYGKRALVSESNLLDTSSVRTEETSNMNLDKLICSIINMLSVEHGIEVVLHKLQGGLYLFGDKKLKIVLSNGKLFVRIGGGYEELAHYLFRHSKGLRDPGSNSKREQNGDRD
eukprot:Nk52_evm10s259 gene=Nk52_evmTU10s259